MKSLTKHLTMNLIAILVLAGLFLPAKEVRASGFFDRNPVEIEVSDQNPLTILLDMAIDIDHVRGGRVRAYVTREEFTKIRALGFPVSWQLDQPRLKREALL